MSSGNLQKRGPGSRTLILYLHMPLKSLILSCCSSTVSPSFNTNRFLVWSKPWRRELTPDSNSGSRQTSDCIHCRTKTLIRSHEVACPRSWGWGGHGFGFSCAVYQGELLCAMPTVTPGHGGTVGKEPPPISTSAALASNPRSTIKQYDILAPLNSTMPPGLPLSPMSTPGG